MSITASPDSRSRVENSPETLKVAYSGVGTGHLNGS